MTKRKEDISGIASLFNGSAFFLLATQRGMLFSNLDVEEGFKKVVFVSLSRCVKEGRRVVGWEKSQ